MKITLTNFRQHRSASFVLPDTGLVLLSGENGTGKTSLLASLVYAFYGKAPLYGKAKKVVSHGAKTCTVHVEFQDLKVKRNSHPQRLQVWYQGNVYEGEGAQGVIHQIFGLTYTQFLLSCFVTQDHSFSVLPRPPKDQLAFVEELALSEGKEVDEFKMKIKEKIKELTLLRAKYQGEKVALQSSLTQTARLERFEKAVKAPKTPKGKREECQLGTEKYLKLWKQTEKIVNDAKAKLKELEDNALQFETVKSRKLELVKLLSKTSTKTSEKETSKTTAGKGTIKTATKGLRKGKKLDTSLISTEEDALKDVQEGDVPENEMEDLARTVEKVKDQVDIVENYEKIWASIVELCTECITWHRMVSEHKIAIQKKLSYLDSEMCNDDTFADLEKAHDRYAEDLAKYQKDNVLYLAAQEDKSVTRDKLTKLIRSIHIYEGLSDSAPCKSSIAMRKYLAAKQIELQEEQNMKPTAYCPACDTLLCWEDGSENDRPTLQKTECESEGCTAERSAQIKKILEFIGATLTKLEALSLDFARHGKHTVEPTEPDNKVVAILQREKDLRISRDRMAESLVKLPMAIERQKQTLERQALALNKKIVAAKASNIKIDVEVDKNVAENGSDVKDDKSEIAENTFEIFFDLCKLLDGKATLTFVTRQKKMAEKKYGQSHKRRLALLNLQNNHQRSLDEKIEIDTQRRKYAAELEEITQTLHTLGATDCEVKIAELREKVETQTLKLAKLSSILTVEQQNLADHVEYAEYQTYLKEKARCHEICEKLEAVERQLVGLKGLEKTGKEAEILALEETTHCINTHAAVHLESLFKSPILVQLGTVRESKTGTAKLQMNTLVEYKGHKFDCIDELSGGERRRCDLAFLLGVNDMVGGKMLILDENLSSIDEAALSEILMFLQTVAKTRLILVVGHSLIAGYFDSEVSMGDPINLGETSKVEDL